VLDNYGTHKTPAVTARLAKHPRFKLHFTPTSASWFNLVERSFAEITTKAHPPRTAAGGNRFQPKATEPPHPSRSETPPA